MRNYGGRNSVDFVLQRYVQRFQAVAWISGNRSPIRFTMLFKRNLTSGGEKQARESSPSTMFIAAMENR